LESLETEKHHLIQSPSLIRATGRNPGPNGLVQVVLDNSPVDRENVTVAGPGGLDPLLSQQPHLDDLCKTRIAEQREHKDWPVQPRQVREAQRRGQRENGSHTPKAMIDSVVPVSAQLARLCRNGILFVRITWMMSVCVIKDSTNQPV